MEQCNLFQITTIANAIVARCAIILKHFQLFKRMHPPLHHMHLNAVIQKLVLAISIVTIIITRYFCSYLMHCLYVMQCKGVYIPYYTNHNNIIVNLNLYTHYVITGCEASQIHRYFVYKCTVNVNWRHRLFRLCNR